MKVLMHSRVKNISVGAYRFCLNVAVLLVILPQQFAMARQDTPLDQLFTIRDIKLDETASSANRARQTAFLKAETEAYTKLLRKITQLEDRALLPELGVAERQALIRGIEIVEEQTSSRRYVATMNVRFEPSRVSSFLASYGVPHVLGTGRPILVLHAHQRGLSTFLWEDDVIVRQARSEVDWVNRIRGYRFARGEINERLAISATEVQAKDIGATLKIGALNSLEAAVLINSKVVNNLDGTKELSFEYTATDSGVTGYGTIPFGNGGEQKALMNMFELVLEVIDGAWRERLLVDTGTRGELNAVVPSLSLLEMAELERRLSAVTLIQAYEVRELGVPLSRLVLRYTGREDQLALALRFEGLDLKSYGNEFMIELRK